MAHFSEIERVWLQHPSDYHKIGGVSIKAIQAAEEYLQGRFPEDYIEFLKRFGRVAFYAANFLGMREDNIVGDRSGYAIYTTNVLRPPKNFLCIMPFGYDGGSAVISLSGDDNHVYEWFPAHGVDIENPMAPTYVEFVANETQSEIEIREE